MGGLLPETADDPASPFGHTSGIGLFEAATRRLESVGARSPRLLFADRSRRLYPGDVAVAEDVTGGTLEALLESDPDAGRRVLGQLAEMLRTTMHAYRAPAFGKVAVVDSGASASAASCEQAHLERSLGHIDYVAAHDPRAADKRDLLEDKLRTLLERVQPRAEYGIIHGELCGQHTLVGPDGEPVLIDIEGLMYFDIEVEHCWMRMRFEKNYRALSRTDLDPDRMRYYQYSMHLDLVGGPLRIAQGDFPNRDWMRGIADLHLRQALDYEV